MSKNVVIFLIILVVVIAGGLLAWYLTGQKEEVNTNKTGGVSNTTLVNKAQPPANTVWIINGDFNPSVMTVEAGEKVTWVNKDESKRKVAADPHPTSSSLPGLVSEELEESGSFSYTFETAGEYYYHDYLNPIKKGKVVVE